MTISIFPPVIEKAKIACKNSGFEVLDHFEDVHDMVKIQDAGSEELAANLFRATQAEAKLRREGIHGQGSASIAHQQVGAKVRMTIKELGGTMPENLPTEENIKESKKRLKTEIKKIGKSKEE